MDRDEVEKGITRWFLFYQTQLFHSDPLGNKATIRRNGAAVIVGQETIVAGRL
jgi:hypothetical protein